MPFLVTTGAVTKATSGIQRRPALETMGHRACKSCSNAKMRVGLPPVKHWQAPIYRQMVFEQTQEDVVLAGVASQNGIAHMILSKQSDQERVEFAAAVGSVAKSVITASVSYVGKANFKDTEQYVRDFRLWTTTASNGLTIEMSAVNGRFILDFIQLFSSPFFVNAFLKELDNNGIVYDLQDVSELELPNIKLPWTE